MHIWNIEKLKTDIVANSISEKEIFIYTLIYITFSAAVMEVMLWLPETTTNIWDITDSISNVLIVFIGTIAAYNSNGGNNGAQFLERYFSIGFVVAMRFFVILIPLLALLVLYYMYYIPDDEETLTSPIEVIPFLVWYAALYWRICVHIKGVKKYNN